MPFPPPAQKAMTQLNREAFKRTIKAYAVRIPSTKVMAFQKQIRNDLFNQPKLRNVVDDGESKETRLILLRSDVTSPELKEVSQESKTIIESEGLGITEHFIDLKYDYWTSDEILRAILPEELTEVPSAFTAVGHIAHMNLREEYLPWKNVIGQVILDKNKTIKTVVNKLDAIDTTFRFFKMEILAGEDNMIAEVKESGCRFRFDFSQVYWNSRLHTEHDRLIQQFAKNEYVCDVFAGVGPFALPAAKKGCNVYANDLNPVSYKWMLENIKLNKIKDNFRAYNLDGREFIHKAIADLDLVLNTGEKWKTYDHFVMNLPATAIEFLDAFRGAYRSKKAIYEQSGSPKLPMVHCHCFSKSSTPNIDIMERIQHATGEPVEEASTYVHWVRKVAPNKDMYCVSFRLTQDMVFAETSLKRRESSSESNPPISDPKKPKVEEGSGSKE
ncbi:guanine(37)-N1-methyltransferase [Umbelopsis sp. PMI_123]|nr:guanine(37)-N1-methyltransferase [Umbelopsis sp. PMI_123]